MIKNRTKIGWFGRFSYKRRILYRATFTEKKNHFTWLIRCYMALRLFARNQFYLEYVRKLTTKFCFVFPYHDVFTGKIRPLYDHTRKTCSSQRLINVLHESPVFFQKLPILSPKHRAQFDYRETSLRARILTFESTIAKSTNRRQAVNRGCWWS